MRFLTIMIALCGACGASSKVVDASEQASARADAAEQTGKRDAGDQPLRADAGLGYTMAGVYRCCLEGQGTSCCTGQPQGRCFAYGGLYEACREQGEEYEGKVICAHCCEGLTRGALLEPGDAVAPELDGLPAGCDDVAPPSLGVCIACGDGACLAGENFCNCPADCAR
jgi:hypothetical protein